MPKKGLSPRIVDGITMFVVTSLSLFVLIYVAYSEGKRGFEQIHIEKITAQGRVVQNSIEKYLREDLPLKQYAGFTTLAAPIVEDKDLDAMAVYDQAGRQIFIAVDKSNPKLPQPSSAIMRVRQDIEVDHGDTHYQVILPLRTRFETVGSIVVMAPTDVVTQRLRASFQALPFVAFGLSLLFAVIVAAGSRRLESVKLPWRQIGYAATFVTMAAFVIFTLITLYFDAVQGKAKASAFTLSQRLNDIVEFKLDVKDLEGLDRAFQEYRRLNSEISEADLIVGNEIKIATDPAHLGKSWVSDSRNFEYMVDLSRSGQTSGTTLAVTVPRSVVFERVLRSVKNFAALFIASALLSGLLLQVASALQRNRSARETSTAGVKPMPLGDTALVIVKPIFFIAVFLDSLTYSFLPKFMQDAATASGMSLGFASLPFTAYYLCFALSLIPAGTFADRRGPRPLIILGLILAGLSVLGLMLPLGIWGMTALRSLSGIGQGTLFIGIQTYILAVTPPEKKTQGAAIIVLGFQGGMISGMAVGSLMVNFLQPQGIFCLAGVFAMLITLYTMWLMPALVQSKEPKGSVSTAVSRLGRDLKNVITSGEFLNTIFCIGIPAKAILTGTITFALPLLLGQLQYRQEDIGQIIMLYGLGVIAATGHVSRLVDRTRNTDAILFWGALLSGIGLLMIGLMGSTIFGNAILTTAVVVIGVVIVGIAHGFINAPVVTHVGQSDLAERIGANPVTTTYRFLERIGHVAGPFLVSQMFLTWGQTPQIVAGIGIATAVLGIFFLWRNYLPRRPHMRAEPVE